jgi:hypothetical protein
VRPLRINREDHVNDNNPTAENRSAAGSEAATIRNDEETLVIDSRAALTPSQLVEQKLIGRLKASPLLVSHVQQRLKPGPR